MILCEGSKRSFRTLRRAFASITHIHKKEMEHNLHGSILSTDLLKGLVIKFIPWFIVEHGCMHAKAHGIRSMQGDRFRGVAGVGIDVGIQLVFLRSISDSGLC